MFNDITTYLGFAVVGILVILFAILFLWLALGGFEWIVCDRLALDGLSVCG